MMGVLLSKESFAFGENTWIQYDRPLVPVTIYTCETCDTTPILDILRDILGPTAKVKTVDVQNAVVSRTLRGEGIKGYPAVWVGAAVENLTAPGSEEAWTETFAQLIRESSLPTKGYWLNPVNELGYSHFFQSPTGELIETDVQHGSGALKVVEFSDFQCPFCARFYQQNNELIQSLIDQNQITYVFKNFPLDFHKEAVPLHRIAQCLWMDHGWEAWQKFTQAAFLQQSQWGSASKWEPWARAQLSDYDAEKILACSFDPAVQEKIQSDMDQGRELGVSGTPTIFVEGRKIPGAVGPDTLQQVIDEVQAKQESLEEKNTPAE